MNPRLYRLEFQPKCFSAFLKRHLENVLHHERHAILRRKLQDARLHDFACFRPHQRIRWLLAIDREVDRPSVAHRREVAETLHRRSLRRAIFAAAKSTLRRARRDRVEPRARISAPFKRLPPTKRLHECLLHDVFGFRRRARHAKRKRIRARAKFTKERGNRARRIGRSPSKCGRHDAIAYR